MTNPNRFLGGLLVIVLVTNTPAAYPQSAAGVLAWTYEGDQVLLLLADHAIGKSRERGWGGFGGSIKAGESPYQAAARETEEESRRYFSREMVEKELEGELPVIDGVFALYFLEVPKIDPALIMQQPVEGMPEAYKERGPYAWIPYAAVFQHLQRYGTSKGDGIEPSLLPVDAVSSWYWDIWLRNIVVANEENALPWLNDDSRQRVVQTPSDEGHRPTEGR